eukprot:9468294-Pyramimonas_sp.AAC.1
MSARQTVQLGPALGPIFSSRGWAPESFSKHPNQAVAAPPGVLQGPSLRGLLGCFPFNTAL